MKMRIRLEGQKELAAYFKAKPAQIRRASRATVRQLTNEGYKELGGTIPRTAGTPVGGFRKVRAKKRTPKGRQRSSTGSIWMGTNKIAAHYVGKMSNGHKGAWAGKYFFENSFVATMKNGYESVWQRTSGGGIKQRYVHLPDARNNAKRAADKIEKKLRITLRKNLEKEMAKGR